MSGMTYGDLEHALGPEIAANVLYEAKAVGGEYPRTESVLLVAIKHLRERIDLLEKESAPLETGDEQ